MHSLTRRFDAQIRETPDLYHSIHIPYIQSIPAGRIQWVYNILEGKVILAPLSVYSAAVQAALSSNQLRVCDACPLVPDIGRPAQDWSLLSGPPCNQSRRGRCRATLKAEQCLFETPNRFTPRMAGGNRLGQLLVHAGLTTGRRRALWAFMEASVVSQTIPDMTQFHFELQMQPKTKLEGLSLAESQAPRQT